MNELEEKIWNILGKKQTAALATVSQSGAPWVRYVTVRAGQDRTLNFCTGLSTRKAGEIAANPQVHLACGNLQPPDDSVFLQIAGRAEIHADAATRHKYWQEEWRRYFSRAGRSGLCHGFHPPRPHRIQCPRFIFPGGVGTTQIRFSHEIHVQLIAGSRMIFEGRTRSERLFLGTDFFIVWIFLFP